MLIDRKEPVIFAGENHMVSLFQPGSDALAISVSCWRCTYSEHGAGNAWVIWNDPAASGLVDLPRRCVFADNAPLGRLIATRFNQYFEGFRDQGYAELEPTPALFSPPSADLNRYRLSCVAGAVTLVLEWRDRLDAALEIFHNTSGPIPYDVSAVICHCARGAIGVNGRAASGEVKRLPGETHSSAFLAFSEMWALARKPDL
jgi:hypothetical protein